MVTIGTLRGIIELEDRFTPRMEMVSSSMEKTGDRAMKLGSALTVGVSGPLTLLGAVATKSFMEFETAMKNVEAALTPMPAELAQLKAAALEWGAATKFSATEAAVALGELGKAGFTVTESIDSLPAVLQLSTISGMDLGRAATLTADTLKQFNLEVDQAGRVNDVLSKGAQASTVDVQQLGESLKYAGPVAGAFGMSIEETVSSLSAFGNVGIKAEMAGTALRNILTDIAVPTKGMREGMEKLGIATLQAADGTTKMSDVVDILQAKGAKAADIMTMFGDRAGPVMVAMVSRGTNEITRMQKVMEGAGGSAEKASKTIMSGFGGAVEEMRGSVETAAIAIGEVLAPTLEVGVRAVGVLANAVTTTLVPAFQMLPSSVQMTVVTLTALVAAVGPVVFLFGQLTTAASVLAGTRGVALLTGSLWSLGSIVPVSTARLWLMDAAQKAMTTTTNLLGGATLKYIGILTALTAAVTWQVKNAYDAAESQEALDLSFTRSINPIRNAVSLYKELSQIISDPMDWWARAKKQKEDYTGATKENAEALKAELAVFERIQDMAPPLPKLPVLNVAQQMAQYRQVVQDALKPQRDFVAELGNMDATLDKLSKSTIAQIKAAKEGNATNEEVAANFNLSAEAVERLITRQKDVTKTTKDLTKESDRLKKIEDQLFGRDDIRKVNDYLTALGSVNNVTRLTTTQKDVLHKATNDAMDAYKALGEAAPASLTAVHDATVPVIKGADDMRLAFSRIKLQDVKLPPGLIEVTKNFAGVITEIPPKITGIGNALTGVDIQTMKWSDGLKLVSQSFTQLAQSSGGALAEITQMLGKSLNFANLGAESAGQFVDAFKAASLEGAGKDWGGIITNMAAGLVGGVGAVIGATDPATNSRAGQMIGGAMSGAAIGAMVAGPWGAAAGAVVGFFVGYFRGSKARREMEIVGKEWGADISKGLYDTIESTQGELDLGRVEASLYHMKDIIGEAGGLNEVNFDKFLGKLRDVYVAFVNGAFTTAEATKAMRENFSAFADHVVKQGGIASQKFQEILRLNVDTGLNSAEIMEFVAGRTSVVSEGLVAMAGPLLDSITAWKAANAEAEEAGLMTATNATFVAQSSQEFADLGVVAVGAFAAAREAGLSYYESFQQLGTGLDELLKAQTELGIVSDNVALNDLIHFKDRVNASQTLVKATESLGSTLEGLSQIGALNTKTLAAMESQGLRTFDRLKAAGFSENEALSLMQDYLLDVIEAHESLGTPIDANTGALIDQADKLGLLKTDGSSMLDVLKTGFENLTQGINRLITTLGGVPVKFDEVGNAINKIPKTITVDWDIRVPQIEVPEPPPVPQFRTGTDGFQWFGDGTLVELHGWEKVVPAGAGDDSVRAPAAMTSGATSGRSVYVDQRGAFFDSYSSLQKMKNLVSDSVIIDRELRRQSGIGGGR